MFASCGVVGRGEGPVADIGDGIIGWSAAAVVYSEDIGDESEDNFDGRAGIGIGSGEYGSDREPDWGIMCKLHDRDSDS